MMKMVVIAARNAIGVMHLGFELLPMGVSTWMIQLLGFEMIHLSRPMIRIDGSLQTFQSPKFSCRKLVSFLSLPLFLGGRVGQKMS